MTTQSLTDTVLTALKGIPYLTGGVHDGTPAKVPADRGWYRPHAVVWAGETRDHTQERSLTQLGTVEQGVWDITVTVTAAIPAYTRTAARHVRTVLTGLALPGGGYLKPAPISGPSTVTADTTITPTHYYIPTYWTATTGGTP
ncbi:hypothetical protein [Pseudoglutamicibacter cumminsii]|uniref:hypothetical protein n=1 Tax=Pseudoglutamicibacter cumminsii TaxID=156979 RepID=UPI0021A6AE39|nr:hypothetical protein [Pseudoglutamicibacter cumminsii]MCT1686284.1 hypothetical protein [Pseudoglutamicibacter cumminsii]